MKEKKVYELTKEDILRASKKHPCAESTLKELYPDAFKDEWVLIPCDELDVTLPPMSNNEFYIRLQHNSITIALISPFPGTKGHISMWGSGYKVENTCCKGCDVGQFKVYKKQ